ncbi:MAG TPA: aminoglycoside phosphotransferase, partial [Rhodobacterales bacterium]|nr:aminoglycoside phosphotransferase [Rhodobacterales bacterium]
MDAIAAACRDVFQKAAKRVTPLHGGDLSEVTRVTLFDGREVVAKQGAFVDREARMLAAIAATGMPAPKVLGVVPGVMFLE